MTKKTPLISVVSSFLNAGLEIRKDSSGCECIFVKQSDINVLSASGHYYDRVISLNIMDVFESCMEYCVTELSLLTALFVSIKETGIDKSGLDSTYALLDLLSPNLTAFLSSEGIDIQYACAHPTATVATSCSYKRLISAPKNKMLVYGDDSKHRKANAAIGKLNAGSSKQPFLADVDFLDDNFKAILLRSDQIRHLFNAVWFQHKNIIEQGSRCAAPPLFFDVMQQIADHKLKKHPALVA